MIPLAVVPLADPAPLPLQLSRPPDDEPRVTGDAALTFDFDLDAINAILHVLWATGALDEAIRERGVTDWFNESEPVRQYLSVRAEDLTLSLPPTIEAARPPALPFTVATEAALTIADGQARTRARLFGRIGFDLASDDDGRLTTRLDSALLALSCERIPERLSPCYGPIVATAAERSPELAGPVSDAMTEELDRILRSRPIGTDEASFAVDTTRIETRSAGRSGWVRIALSGTITSK